MHCFLHPKWCSISSINSNKLHNSPTKLIQMTQLCHTSSSPSTSQKMQHLHMWWTRFDELSGTKLRKKEKQLSQTCVQNISRPFGREIIPKIADLPTLWLLCHAYSLTYCLYQSLDLDCHTIVIWIGLVQSTSSPADIGSVSVRTPRLKLLCWAIALCDNVNMSGS